MKEIKKGTRLCTNKCIVTYACYFFFVLWRIALIIHYEGWYAFDETYHISSSNNAFYFSSQYDTATYINSIIHWLSNVIGRSYYVYKLIPLLLSILSMGALFYVLYHLASHTYSIIVFAFICCFHGVIIFNHLYIREYIWDEAILSGLVFLFYRMYVAQKLYIRISLYLLYIALATGLVILQSGYWIALAIAVFGCFAFILNIVLKKYLQRLKRSKHIYGITALVIFLFIIIEIIIVTYRTGAISIPLPDFVSRLMNLYDYWGHAYFTRNFYRSGIGLVIGVAAYGYYLLKNINNYSNNIIGIYCLGVIPFICFNMIWFDCFPMRVYASYFPIFVLIAVLGFDTFPNRIPYRCIIAVLSIIVVLKPQAETNLIEYIKVPYIWNETNFNDYGGLIRETQQAMKEGRKCVCIWSNEHEEAAFVMNADYTIALANSINILNEYTKEDLYTLLKYFQDTNESYVLMIGTHCDWKLNDITEDFLDTLFTLYPYSEYERRAYLFYIN